MSKQFGADKVAGEMDRFTMHESGECYVFDDDRIWHMLTPVAVLEGNQYAYRDTLAFDMLPEGWEPLIRRRDPAGGQRVSGQTPLCGVTLITLLLVERAQLQPRRSASIVCHPERSEGSMHFGRADREFSLCDSLRSHPAIERFIIRRMEINPILVRH